MKEPNRDSFIKSEDFAVLVTGGLLLLMGLVGYLVTSYQALADQQSSLQSQIAQEQDVPIRSIEWHKSMLELKSLHGSKTPFGKWLKKWSGSKPGNWFTNPFDAMRLSEDRAREIRIQEGENHTRLRAKLTSMSSEATRKYQLAKDADFLNEILNEEAVVAIERWKLAEKEFSRSESKINTKPFSKWWFISMLAFFMLLLFGAIQYFRGEGFLNFALGFVVVFAVGFLSYLLAAQSSIKNLGIGYAAWAILLGLIISNTVGTPQWIKSALTTELYIKTGLVLLGAEILFSKILAIGLPGIFVAWVVTPIVLITTYWFGQKVLKIKSKTLNITISADMSVCGVSAAVATAAASKASKEELTLAIGLSMIFTSVMMVVLPLIINMLGLPEILGGAWIGGTIDATGAVVAAGAFLGDDALNVAATIKMIQNILIGIIAFGVAIFFSKMEGADEKIEVGWGEIWRRFPKFILGFIGASIVFSLIYATMDQDMAYSILDQGVLGGYSKNIRGWLFCLAFVSIGLSTNFRELKKHFSGGKPLVLYICGQTFNLCLTLLVAYIMFYLVFPEITANI